MTAAWLWSDELPPCHDGLCLRLWANTELCPCIASITATGKVADTVTTLWTEFWTYSSHLCKHFCSLNVSPTLTPQTPVPGNPLLFLSSAFSDSTHTWDRAVLALCAWSTWPDLASSCNRSKRQACFLLEVKQHSIVCVRVNFVLFIHPRTLRLTAYFCYCK